MLDEALIAVSRLSRSFPQSTVLHALLIRFRSPCNFEAEHPKPQSPDTLNPKPETPTP